MVLTTLKIIIYLYMIFMIFFVDEYNKNTGEKLATFKINEKNQTVIAVLDELAERVHQLVPNAGNQVSSLRAKSVCL